MAVETYSTYEAKARFSEILRKVRNNKRVVITSRGRPVAEVVPFRDRAESLEERLSRLEDEGVVGRAAGSVEEIATVARRPGALRRFLEERE